MSVNFDFEIIDRSGVPGISLIVARNEDAYRYLTDEADMAIMDDGTAPLATEHVGDFISDASWAHLCCEFA